MLSVIIPICGGCVATIMAANLTLNEMKATNFVCENPNITLEHSSEDVYQLIGNIDVPHPGYKYDFTFEDGKAAINLYSDAGIYPMMIGSVEVKETIQVPLGVDTVELNFIKNFNWGDDTVICSRR